jgi:DNA-directed RNA polymerase subunit RPC12/RpoP
MAENLRFYEAGRNVPQEAQKQFNNGRFSGTDINPMWRIKKLTELFGPAGLGWYYEVISERSETVGDTVMAIVDLNLYIKDPDSGEWSRPIFGTGGNVLLAKGRASDEGYKMALTDALSVACKALGIGADIYYSKDKTKYTAPQEAESGRGGTGNPSPTEAPTMTKTYQCRRCGMEIDEETANASYAESKRILCPECLQAYRDWKSQQGQGGQNND